MSSTHSLGPVLDAWLDSIYTAGYPPIGGYPCQLAEILGTNPGLSPRLVDMLDSLFGKVEPELHAFCSVSEGHLELEHSGGLEAMCARGIPAIEAAILSLCAQLVDAPVHVRATHPGALLRELMGALVGPSRNKVIAELLARIEAREPAGWQRLHLQALALDTETEGWRHWPHASTLREFVVGLDTLDEAWAQCEVELCAAHRGRRKRRDPAFRRAHTLRKSLRGLLSRLLAPRGDLRLLLDYSTSVLDRSARFRCRSAHELLLLDVLGRIDQAFEEQSPSLRSLGVGDCCRRKRIQRARQQAVTCLTKSEGCEWSEETLDHLRSIRAQLHPSPPCSPP